LLIAALLLCSAFTASAQAPSSDESAGSAPPNILFILADDLGLEGVSSYGGALVETPNIDRLADEGMTFTHMFVNPYCTPTRSELLTGRYPFATNTLFPIWDYERHKNDVLDVAQPSFARQLKQAGYRTAIAGKWQLSFLSKQDWVHDFGFDTYQFWQLMDADNQRTTRYHNPYYRRDGEVIHDEIKDRYGPDVTMDFLTDFMRRSRDEGRPFLAYYTALLPHYPWVPTPDSKDQTVPDNNLHGGSTTTWGACWIRWIS
jgi:arylsulfatase A